MITEEDLIGTWKIVENYLKETDETKQKQIEGINLKYELTYRKGNKYSEKNNGIVLGKMANFGGNFKIKDENILVLSIRSFAFIRKYRLEADNQSKTRIKYYPLDDIYCDIYGNIDYMILEKV